MDNAVNCATMFAMFASNRRLLLHCCCCYRKCNDCKDDRYRRVHKSGSPLPSPTEEPSFKTMSDFPQPHGMMAVTNSDSGGLSSDEEIITNKRTLTSCDLDPNLSKSTRCSRNAVYQDAAENAGFKSSKNGINYLFYLDSDRRRSCWYYKSKLFWTWFLYYFCFCGKGSVCKCYFCVCSKRPLCKTRLKEKRHVMKYMFGAAKKIQYNRYCARYKVHKFQLGIAGGSGHIAIESNTDISPRLTPHFTPRSSQQRNDTNTRHRGAIKSVDSNKSIESIPEEEEESVERGHVEMTGPNKLEQEITAFDL